MGDLLKGKHVVVTGGNKGLARALAIAAAAEGAKVAIGGRTEKDGQETLREISSRTGIPARFIRCDLTRVEECGRLIREAEEAFGPVNGPISAPVHLRKHLPGPGAHRKARRLLEQVAATTRQGFAQIIAALPDELLGPVLCYPGMP